MVCALQQVTDRLSITERCACPLVIQRRPFYKVAVTGIYTACCEYLKNAVRFD